MRPKRAWAWGAVIAALSALALIAYTRAGRPNELSYRTVPVERGRLTARVTATGVLSALVTVQVGSQVSGRIQEIHADFNSQVKKGQLIAKIDPQLYQAAVEQAHANSSAAVANVAKAKAQHIDAERQFQRAKALRARNLIAQADLDAAETNRDALLAQLEVAKGSVEQAKAALHQAEVNLGYTAIISPINGVVISRNVDVGQTVAASLQAPILFTIAEDLRKMQVDTNVAEADVGKLRAEMEATFRVDSFPNERFTGTIRQIRNAPQTIQNVVTYDAVIDVENPELELKPGMTANVTIIYDDRENVLKVPNAALRFKPPPALLSKPAPQAAPPDTNKTDGAKRTVWVLRGQRPEELSVKVGLTDGTATEIAGGGLATGDQVITEIRGGDDKSASGGGAGPIRRIL